MESVDDYEGTGAALSPPPPRGLRKTTRRRGGSLGEFDFETEESEGEGGGSDTASRLSIDIFGSLAGMQREAERGAIEIVEAAKGGGGGGSRYVCFFSKRGCRELTVGTLCSQNLHRNTS